MLVINPMTSDTRVDKEAASLAEDGHEVMVVATASPGLPSEETRQGFTIHRLPYRRVAKHAVTAPLQRARGRRRQALDTLAAVPADGARGALTRGRHDAAVAAGHALRAAGGAALRTARSRQLEFDYWHSIGSRVLDLQEPDVVHAHDLGTLAAAVRIADRAAGPRRPRVVYDSHELYVEQQTKWLPRERRMWALHERRWIRHADAVITVSPGIAAELQRRYRLSETPTLVLNTPRHPAHRPDESQLVGVASDVRRATGVADANLAVYVGTVKPGRGVDLLLPAMLHADWHLALVGAGDNAHVANLQARAVELGLASRLHVLPAVPADHLPTWISTADVGVHPMAPTCLNHELALPNKLFDYVFAGLPVAVSALPEMRRMVMDNGLGTVFDPHEPTSIAMQVAAAIGMGHDLATSPLLADLSWEHQAERLRQVHRRLS